MEALQHLLKHPDRCSRLLKFKQLARWGRVRPPYLCEDTVVVEVMVASQTLFLCRRPGHKPWAVEKVRRGTNGRSFDSVPLDHLFYWAKSALRDWRFLLNIDDAQLVASLELVDWATGKLYVRKTLRPDRKPDGVSPLGALSYSHTSTTDPVALQLYCDLLLGEPVKDIFLDRLQDVSEDFHKWMQGVDK